MPDSLITGSMTEWSQQSSLVVTVDTVPGHYNTPISWGRLQNHISSACGLPLNGTTAIALFQHTDFEGRMTVLYESVNRFRALDFSDVVGIVCMIVSGVTWKLYERSNYRGGYTLLSAGTLP